MSYVARLCLVCLLLIPLCTQANTVQEGNIAFAKGDYPAAIRAFESALASQGPSAGVYYNLAMAQKGEERAQAAVNLRRAILLDPRMVDARMALSEIERSQGIVSQPSDWREFIAERIPLKALLIAGSALIWVGAFLLLFFSFAKTRRLLRLVAAFLLMAIGAGLFSVGYLADPRVYERDLAVVTEKSGLALLSAPADQSSTVLRLPTGAALRIVGRSGDWAFCSAPGGERGWAPSKALEGVVPAT